MTPCYYLAMKSIGLSKRSGRKPCSLKTAARHNLREIQAELGADGRMDASRSEQNIVLVGPAAASEVDALAQQKNTSWGIKKRRKDYVQAIEAVFSLPKSTHLNLRNYFEECVAWLGSAIGHENVLSAVIHLDESVPHCHALFLPCRNQIYIGSELIRTKQLRGLRDSFFDNVASKHGLKKNGSRRLDYKRRNQCAEAIINHLLRLHDPVVTSNVWTVLKHEIQHNPSPYMEALGLSCESQSGMKKHKTLVQTMTGIGRKTVEDRLLKRYGHLPVGNLSCVGIAQKSTGIDPASLPSSLLKSAVQNINAAESGQ